MLHLTRPQGFANPSTTDRLTVLLDSVNTPYINSQKETQIESESEYPPSAQYRSENFLRHEPLLIRAMPRKRYPKNDSAGIDAKSASKDFAITQSTPNRCKKADLSSIPIIKSVPSEPLKSRLGCGLKVRTALIPPIERAEETAGSITAKCPRCTPSNTPIAKWIGFSMLSEKQIQLSAEEHP